MLMLGYGRGMAKGMTKGLLLGAIAGAAAGVTAVMLMPQTKTMCRSLKQTKDKAVHAVSDYVSDMME